MNHDDEHEITEIPDITERLHRLAGNAQVGSVEPHEDVRRGRARLRRRQTLAVVGSIAAVVGVAGGVALANGLDGGETPIAADEPSPPAAVTVTASTSAPSLSADPAGCTTATPDPLSDLQTLRDPLHNVALHGLLTSYATVLASHLDPGGTHLQTTPTGLTGMTTIPCDTTARQEFGTKLAWTNRGQRGEAMVFVSVTNDWRNDQIRLEHDAWSVAVPPLGTSRAWTATDSGSTAVAVERQDGTVVALEADRLFGNNSTTPVAGFGFPVDELLQVAADPRFQLPH